MWLAAPILHQLKEEQAKRFNARYPPPSITAITVTGLKALSGIAQTPTKEGRTLETSVSITVKYSDLWIPAPKAFPSVTFAGMTDVGTVQKSLIPASDTEG